MEKAKKVRLRSISLSQNDATNNVCISNSKSLVKVEKNTVISW